MASTSSTDIRSDKSAGKRRDRKRSRTPVERLRVRNHVDESFFEIWVITHAMDDASDPHRFLLALRRPQDSVASIFHIIKDDEFPSGHLLQYDHDSRFADERFTSTRGIGVLKTRHVLNFFRTLLDVPIQPNNEWILTLLYRLERNYFITDGKTMEWLHASGQIERYQAFWDKLNSERQQRYLPDGPKRPRWFLDPEAYWALDTLAVRICFWDKDSNDWLDWPLGVSDDLGGENL